MRVILFLVVVCLVLAALLETANSKPADKKAKKGASTPAKGKASPKAATPAKGKAAKDTKSPTKKDAKPKKATKPKNAKSTPSKDKKSPAMPKTIKAAEPKPESSVPGPSSAPVVAERDVVEASGNDWETVDDFGAEFDEDNDLAEEEEPLNDDAFDDFSGMGLDQDKPKSNMDE
uniref:1106 effector family protein variant 1106_N10 n=1 Tax=Globodera rostochiensis TaxID=31243 RepID=I0C096_GLORO|nr:1106 effector family protein variant 1106_N10 [Globodera rostochiensis]